MLKEVNQLRLGLIMFSYTDNL